MKRLAFLPIILGLGIVGFTIVIQGSNPAVFFFPAAVAVVFALGFVLLLGLYTPAEMARAFRVVEEAAVSDRHQVLAARAFFTTVRNLMLALGPFALVLGTIHMVEGVGRDDMAVVGNGAAMSVLGLWYSFGGLAFIAIPGLGAVRKKLARLDKPDSIT